MRTRVAIIAAFVMVIGLPFLVRALSGRSHQAGDAARGLTRQQILIVVTPHIEPIRIEFGAAFARWHQRVHGEPAAIDWRSPGGTTEIVKQLEAQMDAAARDGRIGSDGQASPGTAGYDVFFGGGSYEHGKMKSRRTFAPKDGIKLEYTMGQPARFKPEQLEAWFGQNKIGTQRLYDPDQVWIGTALSGFGIMYNKDVLADLGLPEPKTFSDLCDPRYAGRVALADPQMSGSVTTTLEAILNKEGWDAGWRVLRELSANARYFAAAATRVPIDVSQGEAAAGLAIDFYGRSQAQFTLQPGEDPSRGGGRVGYVDPEGVAYIDADPITILNGAHHFDLAKRFVEFCLSEEGQALWQMPARASAAGAGNPKGEAGEVLGPEFTELRRMPVRRVMFEPRYHDHYIDKANPFDIAADVPGRGWRDLITPLMSAFGADVKPELDRAWQALNQARAAAKAGTFDAAALAKMEAAFYAMPEHTMKDGAVLALNESNYKAISADVGRWRNTGEHAKRTLIAYTEFFRGQYRLVERVWRDPEEANRTLKERADAR